MGYFAEIEHPQPAVIARWFVCPQPRIPRNAYPRSSKVISGLRFFSPEFGRWANRDPIGEMGGFNLYGFVYNTPLAWVDSSGLLVFDPVNPGNEVPPIVVSPSFPTVPFPPRSRHTYAKLKWDADCDCVVTEKMRQEIDQYLEKALSNLLSTKSYDLPENLTREIGACLQGRLSTERTIECSGDWDLMCHFASAYVFPPFPITLCVNNPGDWGGDASRSIAQLLLHEMVHTCGILGHRGDWPFSREVNDPDDWVKIGIP